MTDEQEKIAENIRQLEAAKASGILAASVADASILALRAQLAALQKAESEKPVFQIGGDVGGSVVVGNHNTLLQPLREGASPQELRAAYLNHLLEATSQLQLSGIDPKTASEAEARLNLGAVYTALLTLTSERDELAQQLEELAPVLGGVEGRRFSPLEQLNRYNRFVLLGDPGSGKSTFVNFVAMCLAGEALKHKDANLAALTAPLPVDEDRSREKDEKPKPQPWEHGALLPIRVILRDFAARGLPPSGAPASAKTLWDFIVSELENWALREFEKPLAQELLQKGGLLLLDGLDEVPDADQRRAQIKQAIEGFAASFPKCRILVTSRTYAYQKQDWRLNGFTESVLAPFSKGQIRNFVERWYAHIGLLRRMNAEDAQGRGELLKRAIFNSDRLLGLAERPLLLTLMASLHAWRGGTLPEKREELYADAVDLLLDWWESPKAVRDARGELVVRQPSLTEWLKVDRQKMRALLEELAFKAHASQSKLTGTADIAEGDLVSGLMRLSQNPEVNPRQLVDYLSLRAGLLIPRGVGVFTFPHRTFQEYLAACYLTDHDYPEQVAELACADFNRWREVALLAGAKAARGTASAIWALVDALCYADPAPDSPEKYQWGAHLAGQALVESGSLNHVSERNLPKQQRVQTWLVQILETGCLPALERARAGDTLASLGDPRLEVLTCEQMAFCHIPAGEFLFGEGKNQKKIKLAEYWIGKYPVTNAQFAQFVAAGGYQNPAYWSEAIKEKSWTKAGFKSQYENTAQTAPVKYGEPFSLSNHPVVGITWYEALAFGHWLTEQSTLNSNQWTVNTSESVFREQLKAGKLKVDLPSEEEWEKAARGTDGRTYPWQGEFDPNKANTIETGVSSTTTVGAFPGGQSPSGLLDASGNVWEWTASPYDQSTYVLCGGSFAYDEDYARCAYRNRNGPDHRSTNRGFRVIVSVVSRASL